MQKPLEEALGRYCIPAILDEDVEHDPVLIHNPPEIVQRAVDPDEHLVEVSGVAGLWAPLSASLFRNVGPDSFAKSALDF